MERRIAGEPKPLSTVVVYTDAPDGPARWKRAYALILDAARRRTEQAEDEQGIDKTRPCV